MFSTHPNLVYGLLYFLKAHIKYYKYEATYTYAFRKN